MFRIITRVQQSVRATGFRLVVNAWTEPLLDRFSPARTTGAAGERLAERFLRRKGWITVARNFLARHGELDLVMVDGDRLVFVEVKTWRSLRMGQSPAEAVTGEKEKSVALAATEFLREHHLTKQACRFDVVAVLLDEKPVKIDHFPAAFEPPIEW